MYTRESCQLGYQQRFLWNIEGYIEEDRKVPGFTCPLVMSPTSRRVSPHKCYWLHKKIEEVSRSTIRKNVPLKWNKGFMYRPEEFVTRKSKRLLGLSANYGEVESKDNENYVDYFRTEYEQRIDIDVPK